MFGGWGGGGGMQGVKYVNHMPYAMKSLISGQLMSDFPVLRYEQLLMILFLLNNSCETPPPSDLLNYQARDVNIFWDQKLQHYFNF